MTTFVELGDLGRRRRLERRGELLLRLRLLGWLLWVRGGVDGGWRLLHGCAVLSRGEGRNERAC